jgi:hypothetical protein
MRTPGAAEGEPAPKSNREPGAGSPPRKGPWRAMISELHDTYWDALPVAGQPVYVGDRWWLSSRRLKSVVSVAEQGCSLRRVGRHWRVRWSCCWRGRRRLLGRWSLSWRRVWDCHARPKSRRKAGARRPERRDGSKDQGCCRRGGKCFVHFSTFRTPDGKNCPRQVKPYAHSQVVI